MGLARLIESEWLQADPDLAARAQGFAVFPDGIQLTPASQAPGAELAAMLGVTGGLPEAAASHHEDMCLLIRLPDQEHYRIIGAAVAWLIVPEDWWDEWLCGYAMLALAIIAVSLWNAQRQYAPHASFYSSFYFSRIHSHTLTGCACGTPSRTRQRR